MSWEDVDLTALPSGDDLVPTEQDFVFELLPGAKFGKYQQGRVEFAGRIAAGNYEGRVLYGSYPDPTEQPWVLGVFNRMIKALGGEVAEDEKNNPIDFLNRNAGKFFVSKVNHRTSGEGEDAKTRMEIKIGNIKAYVA